MTRDGTSLPGLAARWGLAAGLLLACDGEARSADRTREPAATVRSLAEVEHRQKGAGEIFLLARGEQAFLGKLEMAAGGEVPEHRDATEEYIHILEGGGTFSIDDRTHAVGPGATIYMPANAKVSFKNGPTKLVAIQVFAGPGPAAKYDAWTPVAP
jgi:quercetin dioxygenase-like cupin family protein